MTYSINPYAGQLSGFKQTSLSNHQSDARSERSEYNREDSISLSREALELSSKTDSSQNQNTVGAENETGNYGQSFKASVSKGHATFSYKAGPDGQLYAGVSNIGASSDDVNQTPQIVSGSMNFSQATAANHNTAANAAQLEAKAEMEPDEGLKQANGNQVNLQSTVQMLKEQATPQPAEEQKETSNKNRNRQNGYARYAAAGSHTNSKINTFLAAV